MNKIKRKRRTFTDDFKQQMFSLYQHGKSRSEIVADRGKEFDNRLLADCFNTFNIAHSLSKKGCPYDNAVAEATFKTIKTEFVKDQRFNSTAELQCAFSAYAYWYNHKRLHSLLGCLPPVEFKKHLPLNFFV